MAYRIRYHAEARQELNKCNETYGPTDLPQRLATWLDELATEAETKDWNLSVDVEKLLETSESIESLVRSWPDLWQRFWNASLKDKFRAALVVIATTPAI
jgi:hypothetical protein